MMWELKVQAQLPLFVVVGFGFFETVFLVCPGSPGTHKDLPASVLGLKAYTITTWLKLPLLMRAFRRRAFR